MATNCPQLLKPRACRSALCFRTAVSKPVREMSCKICEKMLHTLFKAESSSDSSSFDKLNLSETLSLLLFEGDQHSGANLDETDLNSLDKPTRARSKYPPAEPGALVCEPLEAAGRGR